MAWLKVRVTRKVEVAGSVALEVNVPVSAGTTV